MPTNVDLTTKPEGLLTCQQDAAFQRHTMPDGILYGFNQDQVSASSSSVTFGKGGLICCCGRLVHINDGATVSYTEGVSKHIILRVKNDSAELDESYSLDDIPDLVQDDINMEDTTGQYEILLASLNDTSEAIVVLPKVSFGGIYYGSVEPNDEYPYQDGCIYVKYSQN